LKADHAKKPPKAKIDRNLNLVIPVDTDKGTFYVHVMPISREVFEQNFLFLGRVYGAMFDAHGALGPRSASLFLKRIAAEMGVTEEVNNSLLPEMQRLANVLVPAAPPRVGYEVLPWQQALEHKLFDDEDARGVENILVFFMLTWHMSRREELPMMLEMANGLGAQLSTSLTPTAFAASLKTSTEGAPTAPKGIRSSTPS
jgi:hypothetical protein